MFCVVSMVGRELGRVKTDLTYDEALEYAVALCLEQCDEDEAMIREELTKDNDFWYGATADEGWSVYIAQPEGKQ